MLAHSLNLHAEEPALFHRQGFLRYKELFALAEKKVPTPSTFFALSTVNVIALILSHFLHKKPFFPLSPREKVLPNYKLPDCQNNLFLQTSGSSKAPKIVSHSFESFAISALYPLESLSLHPGDVWQLSLPLNHAGGLAILFRVWLSGAAVALPSAKEQEKITHISFVPTQLRRYLETESKLPNLKGIMLGGAPIPLSLCERADAYSLPLYLTYGMTETASQVATKRYQKTEGICFGKALPHRRLAVSSSGEVLVKGKTLLNGYLDPATHMLCYPFDQNGWFPTGDLGELTERGLRIFGRKDRMFISGGENIYPEEIERVLMNHPAIFWAKVHVREDALWGGRPTVTAVTNTSIEKGAIVDYLSQYLPKFKVPDPSDISLTKELPDGELVKLNDCNFEPA